MSDQIIKDPPDLEDNGPVQVQSTADFMAKNELVTMKSKGLYVTVFLALLLALMSVFSTGYLWWQHQIYSTMLRQSESQSVESIRDIQGMLDSFGDRVDSLQNANEDARNIARDLDRRLEEFPERFQTLERRLNSLQGVSDSARREWIRAEAEYYLVVANTVLGLSNNWEGAITALELADAKLRELGNPSFRVVNEQILEERESLIAVQLPDKEGLSYSLARLLESVESLPIASVAPVNLGGDQESIENITPNLERIWYSFKQAMNGMISVERTESASRRMLSNEEQALVKRQLELELELARLALFRSQGGVFEVSLSAASALLSREFDASDQRVESALLLLQEMANLNIQPELPDISGSLELLRRLSDREG
ncbi:MAG: uroporphyrinogen-III C-methyltransferase [Candidatus Rariloculaceae bacterium]